MKQQELIDLLESWGFREVRHMFFELNDKIAKYRVVITTNHVDFTVYVSYLGKEFNAFNRIAIETLNMESPEFVIYILKGLLIVAMGRLLNDYAQNSFLKESVFSAPSSSPPQPRSPAADKSTSSTSSSTKT